MRILDGAGREPPILHLTVKALYVSRRELSELDVSASRHYVASYLSLVRGLRAGLYASFCLRR